MSLFDELLKREDQYIKNMWLEFTSQNKYNSDFIISKENIKSFHSYIKSNLNIENYKRNLGESLLEIFISRKRENHMMRHIKSPLLFSLYLSQRGFEFQTENKE